MNSTLPESNVKNFTTDWRDGRNLSALVDYCKPGLIPDHASLDPNNALENCTRAMDIAEKELGVPSVMHPEDLAVEKPEELSVMTYVSGFCRPNSAGPNSLLEWINEKIPKQKVTNFGSDWVDGRSLGALTDAVSGGEFPESETMKEDDGFKNCQESMDAAEELLDIKKTAPPEDFAEEDLDQLTRMAYLTQFRHASFNPDKLVSKLKAVGPGVTGDSAEKETNFLVRGRVPQWAELEAKVHTPSGSELPVKQQTSKTASFLYTPETAGDYIIDITLNQRPIPGSPYHVSHTPPSNVAGCIATGNGLGRGRVGERAQFSVNCEQGGPGDLQVEIQAPNGNVGTEILEPKDRNYDISYTPLEAGEHLISVTWDGKQIPYSPFTCLVTDPKKCTASGPGLTGASINDSQSFTVKTDKGGPGKLSTEIQGPTGSVPVEIDDIGGGNFKCTYVPQEKGGHTINVRWSDAPITGSPFKVKATAPADPSKCVASGVPEGRLRCGKNYSFSVDATLAGSGELVGTAHGPSVPERCEVEDNGNDLYAVNFSSAEVGPLKVNTSYSDSPIPGSPFEFTVNDPTKVKVNRAAIENGACQVKRPIDFRVSAQYAGEGDLSATVRGPKGEEEVEITPQGDGTYHMHFVPMEGGPHAINIKFDGDEIPDVPIRIFVESGSYADNVVVSQPAPSKVGAYIVEHPYDYKVNTAGAGEADLAANCHGVKTGLQPKLNIIDEGSSRYAISIEAEQPDDYQINILWGEEHVPGSPFKLPVEDKPRASKVIVAGPHFDVGSCDPITLEVNAEKAGAGELNATCYGGKVGSVPVDIKDGETPKNYDLSIAQPQTDVYSISVLWSSENVRGSPFKLNTISPDASKCVVTGPEIPDDSMQPVTLNVDATEAGNGQLEASVFGDTSGETECDISENEPGKFVVSFIPLSNDFYNLNVTWAGEDVPRSPFKINSTTSAADEVFICEPPTATLEAGQAIGICFDTSKGGRGELTAIGKGGKIGEIPVSVTKRSKDKYFVRFVPPEPDVYLISVLWAGNHVKGSPFTINLMPVDINKVRVIGPTQPQGREGPVELMIQTSGAGKGKVTGACIGNSAGNVPVGIKETSTDIYQLTFIPPKPDIYTLAVQYGGQNLVGSPFQVNTFPPNAGKVKVTPPKEVSLSFPIHYKVNATEAGSGRLSPTLRGEKYGQVQLDTYEEDTGLYDLSFTPHHADLYSLSILWDDQDVPNSPFRIDLRPPSADMVKVGELHVPDEAGTGEPVYVDLDCSDAGHGEVKGQAVGDLMGYLPVEVEKKGQAKYRVQFPPKQADEYSFSVLYSNEHVTGSPFQINLIPPQADLVKLVSLSKHYDDKPATLIFDTSAAGRGKLSAQAVGKSGKTAPTKVEQTSPVEYKVTFVPTQQEFYDVNVQWAGTPVKDSPFSIDARPAIHPELVRCGSPQALDINEPVTLSVDTSKAGPGVLTAKYSSSTDGRSERSAEVKPGDAPDTFVVSFVPDSHGKYDLKVFFDDTEVPRSPFPISLLPVGEMADMKLITQAEESVLIPEEFLQSAPPQEKEPENSDDNILTQYLGNPLDFVVDAEDPAKRNGKLLATAVGEETGPATIQASKNADDDTFNVSFNPSKPDLYNVEVRVDDEHIPGSPFKVRYLRPLDASKCYIFGLQDIPPRPEVSVPIVFGVDAKGAGEGKLSVTADGPSTEDEPSVLDVKQNDEDPFIYNITYTPTKEGQHRVHLSWAGDTIPGSPLVFEVGDSRNLQTFPFGKPVSMDFAIDCRTGDLESYGIHEDTGTRYKVKIAKAQKGKFKFGFQPKEPGIYAIHVLLKKKEISGSPFRIRVLEPPKADAVVLKGLKDEGFIGEPINFEVDATNAGGGDLGVRVSGPSDVKDSDLSVVNNKDGTYAVSYTPRDMGTFAFDITWSGIPIPGSPASVNVSERKPVISTALHGEDTTNLLVVGEPAAVSISNLGEGCDADFVTADCAGETTGEADVTVLGKDDGFLVRFVPTVPDDYRLNVKLDKSPIAGSPFFIKGVEKAALSPDFDHPSGPCHSDVEAGKPVSLLQALDYEEPSDVTASVEGPFGPCEATVNTDLKGEVGLEFTPLLSGDYLLHAKKHGSDIEGSPFKITATGKDADPSKVHVVDEDLDIFDKANPFKKPVNFRISTADAGQGTLNITSRGPGKAQVKVFDNKDGTYTCDFAPSVAGKYHIDVMWNNRHIKGSPFLLTFKSRKSKVITGLDLENENFRIGVPHRFKLHCDEIGEGILEILCKPPSAADIKLIPILDSKSYQCEIVPLEIGNREITVQYNGKHILGSPFNVQFELRGDASKCRMIESLIEHEPETDENVSFSISTEGAGKGKLTAYVENTATKERQPASVTQIEEERYNVDFNPGDGSEYLLTVKYDEQHIFGSPFKLVFGPPDADASKCTAEGEGLSSCFVEKWSKFVVDTVDAGPGDLSVSIEGSSDLIEPKITDIGGTKLEVEYLPKKLGNYKILITWGGAEIPGSPFTIKCYNPSDPSVFSIVDPPTETLLGAAVVFDVRGREDQEGELTVSAQSSQDNIVNGSTERRADVYKCTLDFQATGKYGVSVRWNGAHVEGSPFKLKVMTPPKPNLVKAYGPGLENGFIGQEGNFTVETGEGGAGTLAVRVHGPKGAFKINMRRHPDNNRNILVRYDPTYVGEYTIDVTWSEVHVPGSPFKINVNKQ